MITSTLDAMGAGADGKTVAAGPNPQTGPFYVEGAEPGDLIVVTIEKLVPNRAAGLSTSILAAEGSYVDPGSLANKAAPRCPGPSTRRRVSFGSIFPGVIPSVDWRGRYSSPLYELPLRPMLGSIGVAPASRGGRGARGAMTRSIPPCPDRSAATSITPA